MNSQQLIAARSVLGGAASFLVCALASTASGGDWTVAPRVSGQEIFTDNVLYTPTNRRGDFITSVSPGIDIIGESPRLQAKLDYAPTLQLYALTPDQNFIGHNLYANGTAVVVPDLLFFD